MASNRRDFLKNVFFFTAAPGALAAQPNSPDESDKPDTRIKIPVALVQFDAVPEQIDRNLREVERLTERAVSLGARWIMFHEGTLCDYTPRLRELAEPVPSGRSTGRIENLAHRLKCYISFGLSEVDNGRYYITQVFVGPSGFVYKYRKTWLYRHTGPDPTYRNEWVRYDPGTGPDLFLFDGIKATCFICADADAPRCIQRAAELAPQVVFFPINRGGIPRVEFEGEHARSIHAPILATNRVGYSWTHGMKGGSAMFSADGKVLAQANTNGEEEILVHALEIAASAT